MTSDALGDIGDFIGGICVEISLLHLASQIRQNTNSVRPAAEIGSERMRMKWHGIPASNGDIAEIWEKVFRTPGEVTWQEVGR